MSVAATVIVPTHDHGPTLRSSLGSALAQTVKDIEVLVIGDGVPDVTREIVGELSRTDERVSFFDHPKGPRHGELYRHEALAQARGEIVCYLSDDDLWLPEHIETVQEALAGADFVGAHAVHVTPTGELLTWPSDLNLRWFRERMLEGDANFVPLSCAAHTLDVYRRLPEGWSPAPLSSASDLFMWRKVLRLPGLRARSATLPTVVHLPSTLRRGWTAEARVAELEPWAVHVADPEWRREFRAEVFDLVRRQAAAAEAATGAVMNTRTWRFRHWLLGAPSLGAAAKALARRGAGRATER
jgi:GalNAc5-diNAcBac-PP-undecaprenol beta-1,3-glucosyltransferase